MSVVIEGLYIFDESRTCILEHVYSARPPAPQEIISRYTNYPTPQPSILQFSDLNPPTTVYSVAHSNVLLQCTSSQDAQSLAVLEFLHRIVDIFEDFLGSPLLSGTIESNYEVVGQLLAEICDGGVVCNTEPNALKESVEVSSALGKLFTQVGIPSSSPALNPSSLVGPLKPSPIATNAPAIPWRRPNVRHTSNEMYVDIVESLSVIFAPSGRPISARSNGSIVFTSKLSGVPDLVLALTAPGGASSSKSAGLARTMQLPVFHPCVRLARWKENPGELSLIPPDGKFMLAGYEVDLLPSAQNTDDTPSRTEKLYLPAQVDLKSGLGSSGTDFEARLTLNTKFPGVATPKPTPGPRGAASTTPFSFGSAASSGSSTAPVLEAVTVTIPFPVDVRNVTEFKTSRGDATFNFKTKTVEWKIPTKDGFTVTGTATLTGSVTGPASAAEDDGNDDVDAAEVGKANTMAGYYDEDDATITTTSDRANGASPIPSSKIPVPKKAEVNRKQLMPKSIAVSFSVRGWLPSGIKVGGLNLDIKKSRGLGESVKPYKGVKYLTVSKKGVERRL